MAKRRSTRKQKKRNNQIIMAAVGIVIILVVVFGVLSQRIDTATTSLPLEISVQEANTYYEDGAFILDVRTPEEWVEGHIPGAKLIPLDELEARVSELPLDEDIVVICRSGNRSAVGRDILFSAGFETVTSVGGGFNQWKSNGFPSVTGP